VLDLGACLAAPGDVVVGEAPGDGGGDRGIEAELLEVDLVEGVGPRGVEFGP
jgi:hypothetical protein